MSRRKRPDSAQGYLDNLKSALKEQAGDDVRAVMSDANGRRFVWWLIDGLSGVHGQAYALNGATNETMFREGRRSVGIDVMLAIKEIAPERYAEMLGENWASQVEFERARKAADIEAAEDEAQGDYDDGD